MDILIENATVITMDGKRRVLKNHSIAVEDNKISEIAPDIKGEADYEIDASRKLVIPGLINTHTHLAMTLFRGAADDLPLMQWLQEEIWPVEANLEPSHVYAGSLLGVMEMISTGTTTFNDMYYHLDEVARTVEETGIRGVLSYPILDIGGEDQGKQLLARGKDALEKHNGMNDRIKIFLGPHSPYTVSRELLLKTKELAEKFNTGIHIHVSETKGEVEESVKNTGMRPFQYLDDIGFFGENVLAAHATWANKEEIKIIKERGVKIAHNPVSNMKLACGIAPVPDYINNRITVALGTDGAASNNNLDLFEEMKMAALLHKVNTMDATAVPALKVLEMATINGARALGLEDQIGSIEEGKKADLVLLDLDKPNLTPLTNPVSHTVYSARGGDVDTVIIDGKIIMDEGNLRGVDMQGILDFAREQARDLYMKGGKLEKMF